MARRDFKKQADLVMGGQVVFLVLLLVQGTRANEERPSAPAFPREEEIEHLGVKTAHVLNAMEFEINLVAEYHRLDNHARESRDGTFRVEVEFGPTDRLLIEFEYTYLFLRPDEERAVNRPGDVEAEAKYLFLDFGWLAGAAGLAAGYTLEWEADEGEFERNPMIEAFIPISWTPSPALGFHVNVGIEGVRHEAPERFLQAAVEWLPFGDPVVFQLGLTTEAEGHRAPRTSIGPGLLARFDEPEIKLGLGFLAGISESAPDWAVLVNIEIELE